MQKGCGCLILICAIVAGAIYLASGDGRQQRAAQHAATENEARLKAMPPGQREAEVAAQAAAKAVADEQARAVESKHQAEARDEELLDEAKDLAVEAVRKSLAHPLDAKFPFFGPEAYRQGDAFIVKSTVEAKNGFGNYITSSWIVRLVLYNGALRVALVTIDGEAVAADSSLAKDVAADRTAQQASEAAAAKEAQRASKRERNEKAKEAAKLHRPETAAKALKAAQSLESGGNIEAAAKWYRKVVSQYPETPAAEEAQRWLDEHP